MADLGAQLATARLLRFPRLQVVLSVLPLPLLVAMVVVAIMQRWSTLGMIAAAFAVITLARFAFVRVRVRLAVHDQGIVIADRALPWDDLAGVRSWFLRTRAGARFSIVTDKDGEAAIEVMKERWITRTLDRVRAELAAGGAVELGGLRIRSAGIERAGAIVAWHQLDVTEHDGYAILFGGFMNRPGVTFFDSNVPEGRVFRALLRDHRKRTSSIGT